MESASKIIGGRTVVITRCSCMEAIDLELSLAKVAGSVDTTALAAAFAGDIKAALALGLAEALGSVAKNLTHQELIRLMNMALREHVTIDGQKIIDLNATFADRPLEVWQVFIEAVKFNLGPLAGGLRQK